MLLGLNYFIILTVRGKSMLGTKRELGFNGLFEIGQPIYNSLYGGKYGHIYNIRGEQQPDSCGSMSGVISFGGGASLDIVWLDGTTSKATPESLARTSVQWKVFTREHCQDRENAEGYVPEGFATPEYITELLQKAEDLIKTKEQQAAEKAALKAKERGELPGKFPYLTTADSWEKSGQALAAKNIRIALKREFPGQKFSVKSSSFAGGDAVDVSWTDGPTTDEVTDIRGRHQYGNFNGMEDIYEYNNDVFPDVFGRSKYVQEQRRISIEKRLEIGVELGYKDLEADEHNNIKDVSGDISQHIYRVSRERSFYASPATTTSEAPEPKPANTDTKAPTTNEDAPGAADKEPAEIGEYKDKPTIKLPLGNRGFCFGVKKAAAILEYLEEIKEFVDNN